MAKLMDEHSTEKPSLRRWDTIGNNRAAVASAEAADALNAAFYGTIQYPGPAVAFERVVQPGFWSTMLAQDVGAWNQPIVRRGSEIWVAGCGTNQALITALKFPEAHVIGSDISASSLETCLGNSQAVGAINLQLKQESINDVAYADRFDYAICTGVIHHNADPRVLLTRLSRSLTPGGILELMVYNQYHRVSSSAFQLAIRTLAGTLQNPQVLEEAPIAETLVETFDMPGTMSTFLERFRHQPFVYFADSLLQPIEHSYTVASLRDLAFECGLELVTFAVDQFSRSKHTTDWNLSFREPALQARYEALPDTLRWQITNYLLLESSPMLWFYLRRMDSPRVRRSEKSMSEDFLERRFIRTRTLKEVFVRQKDGSYVLLSRRTPFPAGRPPHTAAARLYEALDESAPVAKTVARLRLGSSFMAAHALRVHLATSAYPFLCIA